DRAAHHGAADDAGRGLLLGGGVAGGQRQSRGAGGQGQDQGAHVSDLRPVKTATRRRRSAWRAPCTACDLIAQVNAGVTKMLATARPRRAYARPMRRSLSVARSTTSPAVTGRQQEQGP